MSIHCASRVWELSAQEGSALLLLLALADYADENGFAFPGQKTLADRARLCVRQTRRLLAGLQAAGELLILDRPGRGSLYVVLTGARRQALAAALDRASAYGARLSTRARQEVLDRQDTVERRPAAAAAPSASRAATPDIPVPTPYPDTVMSPTPDISAPTPGILVSSCTPVAVMSSTPDIAMSALPQAVMSTTPDIAMSAPPAPTPDIWAPTPDISAPTPDIAVSAPPDIAMSSDPSLTKDPSEDPSEDPSGQVSWQTILDALSLRMDPATFNLWLRGTRALSLRDGCLTVQAGHANALPWLEHRLARIIERTLAHYLPGVRLRFLAPGDRAHPLPHALDHNPTPGDPSPPLPLPLDHNPAPGDRPPPPPSGDTAEPSRHVPPAPAHAPPAPGPRPAAPTSTPDTIHHPSFVLCSPPQPASPTIASPISDTRTRHPIPNPQHPPSEGPAQSLSWKDVSWKDLSEGPAQSGSEGSIIVSRKKPVSTLPLLAFRARQHAPLPLAASSGHPWGRPERGRHRPQRGPP